MMQLRQRFLTRNPCYQANLARADSRYRSFQDQGPKGLMLHAVGCAQPSAEVFANRWDRADYTNACVHGFIDANTGEVWQTLPWNFRGWHCAGSGNNTHIGVEMCEPACLRYGAGAKFTVAEADRPGAIAAVRRTYQAAVALFAMLCDRFGFDPLRDICSHCEGGRAGIASGHVDPEHLWQGLGLEYTMDGFRRDVAERRKEERIMMEITKNELQAMIDSAVAAQTEALSAKIRETAAACQALAEKNPVPTAALGRHWDEKMEQYLAHRSGKPGSAWSEADRAWAVEQGLIQGTGTNPDGSVQYAWADWVTREQLAAILHRYDTAAASAVAESIGKLGEA